MKCLVYGCMNHDHQGEFVNGMCSPCYNMITTGMIGPTTSFLSKYKQYGDLVQFIANDYIELSYEKAQWQRDDWRKRAKKIWYNS